MAVRGMAASTSKVELTPSRSLRRVALRSRQAPCRARGRKPSATWWLAWIAYVATVPEPCFAHGVGDPNRWLPKPFAETIVRRRTHCRQLHPVTGLRHFIRAGNVLIHWYFIDNLFSLDNYVGLYENLCILLWTGWLFLTGISLFCGHTLRYHTAMLYFHIGLL